MAQATFKQLKSWERRARTNLDRAHKLSCDMIDVLGLDDSLTDYSDGAVEQAENLVGVLSQVVRWKRLGK